MKTVLEKLTKQTGNNNSNFFTFYISAKDFDRERAKKEVKSALYTSIKKESPEAGKNNVHMLMEKAVYEKIENWDEIENGIAIFGEISDKDVLFLEVVSLPTETKKSVFVGKNFDLSQIQEQAVEKVPLIILILQRELARIYTFTQPNNFSKLFEIDNEHIYPKENEYIEKYRQGQNKATFYSTASNITENAELFENRQFINSIFEIIKNDLKTVYKKVIIYYSSEFSDFSEAIMKKGKHIFPKTAVVIKQKNFSNNKQGERELREELVYESYNNR